MPQDQPEPPAPGSDPAGPPAPARPPAGRPTPARRPYRTPRYPVFLGTGVVLGLLVGVGLALYGGGDTVTSSAGVLGYFSAFGVIVGALAGGTLAVLVEAVANLGSRSRRR